MVTKMTKYVNKPLGMGCPLAPSRKEWIQLAMAGASLASSLFGGAKAAQAARAAENRQRAEEARESADYTRRRYQDYVDTAAGQNLVRRAKEYAKENWRKAAGAQAVAGGTASATQMAKDAGNKMIGDTIANIAATDQVRKDSADRQHDANRQRFAQMDMNREMQRAQNITNAAQNASNAMMTMAGAVEQAGNNNVNLGGGSNGGTEYKGVDVSPSSLNTPDSNKTVFTGQTSGISAPVDDWRKAVVGG